MSNITVFVQAHGRPEILEAELAIAATLGELHEKLAALGIKVDAETAIFIDDAADCVSGEHRLPLPGLGHGCRVHVACHQRIKVTVHFLDKTKEHAFPPGAKVSTVKEWAAAKFEMSPKDAAEHVLQLCGSTVRPVSDTPIHELTKDHGCEVCFDFVPEKRVEG